MSDSHRPESPFARSLRALGARHGVPAERIDEMLDRRRRTARSLRPWWSDPDPRPGFRRLAIDPTGADIGEGATRVRVLFVTSTGVYGEADLRRPSGMDGPALAAMRREDWLEPLLDNFPRAMSMQKPRAWDFEFNLHATPFRDMLWQRFQCHGLLMNGLHDVPDGFRGGLFKLLDAVESIRYRAMRRALFDALDPEVRHAMHSSLRMSGSWAGWFSGADADDLAQPPERFGDPRLGADRRQARQLWPGLIDILARPEIDRLIAARAPIAEALAKEAKLDRAQLRALRGVTWQRAAISPMQPMPEIVAKVPAWAIPTTRKDWKTLRGVLQAVHESEALAPERVFERLRGRFDELAPRFAAGAGAGIRDAWGFVYDRLVVPAAAWRAAGGAPPRPSARGHGGSPFEAFESGFSGFDGETRRRVGIGRFAAEMFEAMPVADFLDNVDRWHRALPRHLAALPDTTGLTDPWPPLFGHLDLGEGLVARELHAPSHFHDQGRDEGHCVGGYVDAVRSGRRSWGLTLIASIERDGEILSTVELRHVRDPETEEPAVAIKQNHAAFNAAPEEDARRAAAQLVRRLLELPPERFANYEAGLAEIRERMQRSAPSALDRLCKFDFRDRTMMETAWAELSGYLPRRLRRRGLDAFIETCAPGRFGLPTEPLEAPPAHIALRGATIEWRPREARVDRPAPF